MRRSNDRRAKQWQQRYEAHFNHKIRHLPRFRLNYSVNIHRSALTMTAADKLATEAYSRLLPRTAGPFLIPAVEEHTLTIEEDGTPNTISIDRATRTTSPGAPIPGETEAQHREKMQLRTQTSHTFNVRVPYRID